MRRSWLIGLLVCVAATVASLAAGPLAGRAEADVPPSVTLTSPASEALVIGGQPAFSGTAGTAAGDNADVTVNVYAGGAATGLPIELLSAPVSSGGGYSVAPSPALADGLYTAQAFQSYTSGTTESESSAVSFRVDNASPGIELDPPSTEPLVTQTPTLGGYAPTFAGDASTVSLIVYPGSDTSDTPISVSPGSVAADGSFSIAISPALEDGVYTVVATQNVPNGVVFSSPLTIEVNAVPPALTVAAPAAGADIAQNALTFSGTGGVAYGDATSVDVSIYRGSTATGKPVGSYAVVRSGSAWQLTWPKTLKLGIYTLSAQQSDSAGDVTTVTSTFLVVPPPTVIGKTVDVTSGGDVRVPVACPVPGSGCSGAILILTSRAFQTQAGGPKGHLRVMFASFSVRAGRTLVVSRPLAPEVLKALRRAGRQRVSVTVVTGPLASRQLFTASRTVTVPRVIDLVVRP